MQLEIKLMSVSLMSVCSHKQNKKCHANCWGLGVSSQVQPLHVCTIDALVVALSHVLALERMGGNAWNKLIEKTSATRVVMEMSDSFPRRFFRQDHQTSKKTA